MSEETDILLQAVDVFSYLMDSSYEIVLGRKNKTTVLNIIFEKVNFHHLAGLHKLLDIRSVYDAPAEEVFDNIVEGKITLEDIKKSSFYSVSKERLEIVANIPSIFNNDFDTFKFSKLAKDNTRIKWEFLVNFKYISDDVNHEGYIFLRENKNKTGDYVGISDFMKDKKDFTFRHTHFKLLEIKEKRASEEIIKYVSPTYKKNRD